MRNWTDEQIKAIESKPNIIVSAAAGSGKTAVLVERIIRKLIPDENGDFIPAENLLVVTFARDAAHEMQDRIKKSLKEAFESEKNPSKKAVLKMQMKKIPYADITTIDSFCMHMVKENFHLLGIDSKFSIIDSAEAVIYTYECIEEYFDMLYEKLYDDLVNERKNSVIYKHHIEYINTRRGYYGAGSYLEENTPDDIVADYIASMTDDYFIDLCAYILPDAPKVKYTGYFDKLERDADNE